MRHILFSALLIFLTTLSACSYKKKTVPDRKDSVPFLFSQSAVEEIRMMCDCQPPQLEGFSDGGSELPYKHKLIVNVDELQAKYADIPFHFNINPIADKCLHDTTTIQLWYKSELDFAATALFYSHEMERLGWQQIVMFDSVDEVLFIFRKPERLCALSVRCCQAGYLVKRKKMVEVILYIEKERS